ncbi:hypothetical protein Tco_1182188 [Tanacetum coccineum]
MAALQYKDDHNRIAYLGRERGSEDFTDILSYLDHSPLRQSLTCKLDDIFTGIGGYWVTAPETADRTPRPTFGFTRKLFSNMKLKWEGEAISLTPPMLAIAAAGNDAADEETVPAHAVAGSPAEAHPVPHPPPFSPVRETTPERQPETEWVVPNPVSPGTDWRPWPSVLAPRPPTPPAQTLSLEEPLVFGPVPKPAGYVDPDSIDPIIFAHPAPHHSWGISMRDNAGPDAAPYTNSDAAESNHRRACDKFYTPPYAQFQLLVSTDVLPHERITQNPMVRLLLLIKGKAPHARFEIPAEFLQRCTGQGIRLEEEQATCEGINDSFAANDQTDTTTTDWLTLMMQVGTNPALARELLGADVNEDNFIERMTAIKERKKRALAELRYRALKGKPLKQSEVTKMMRNLVKNQWCAAHNGTITMKAVTAMSKQQLTEEYENICRRLEKDHLLSAQYNLFRPKPVISEPPSKRQRVDRDTSPPSDVPAASTHHADDPDSAGGGSFNPAGTATPMTGSAVPDTAGGTLGTRSVPSDATELDSDDEVPAEILYRGQYVTGAVEPIPESTTSPPRSRSKHRGVRSDTSLWDRPVDDFLSSESESDDDIEDYIPPIPYGAFKDWEIVRCPLQDLLLLRRRMNRYFRLNPDVDVGLDLWRDVNLLCQSLHSDDVEDFWRTQDEWVVSGWRLYPKSSVHVLDLTNGKTVYMFVDKFYPIRAPLLERMLRHRLTVPPSYCRDVVVAGSVIQTIQDGLRESYECLASAPIACTARQMVFNSPWLTAEKEFGSPLQTALVCNSNPLIALTIYSKLYGYRLTMFHVQRVDMVINPPWNLPFLGAKGLTSPEQTATGKGISNPLMAVMVCPKPYGIQLTNVSIPSSHDDFLLNTAAALTLFPAALTNVSSLQEDLSKKLGINGSTTKIGEDYSLKAFPADYVSAESCSTFLLDSDMNLLMLLIDSSSTPVVSSDVADHLKIWLKHSTDGNVYRDNIPKYVSPAAAVTTTNRNSSYRPQMVAKPNSSSRDVKAITTRSGVSYNGPQISSLPKEMENEPKVTKDTVQPSTENIQPPVVQTDDQIGEPLFASNTKSTLPNPSRANKGSSDEKE